MMMAGLTRGTDIEPVAGVLLPGAHSQVGRLDPPSRAPAGALPPHPRASRATRYRYVEFAARAQPGFRNHVVTVDAVPELIDRWGAEECYASLFRFPADILLFLAEHRVDGRPSIGGYDGPVWAPFLPFDIDAHPPATDLTRALELARRTYDLLVDRWRVSPAAVHVYFSGAKGFHVLLDTRAAGRVLPARNLHRVFMRVRLAVLEQLPHSAHPLFDLLIADKVRLLRLPNTRHAGSGLFKVALSADELHAASADDVRALARSPRPLTRVGAAGLEPLEPVAAAPALVERFERARRALRAERGVHPYRMAPAPRAPEAALCAARLALWRADVPPGSRNNAVIRLASALRLAGYAQAQTLDLLTAWSKRQTHPLPTDEVERVTHSAYAHAYPYLYGCRDELIARHCPYAGRLDDCEDYRRGSYRGRAGIEAEQ